MSDSLPKNQQGLGTAREQHRAQAARRKQEGHEFKVILGYIGNSRSIWTTGDPTPNKAKAKVEKDDWRLT